MEATIVFFIALVAVGIMMMVNGVQLKVQRKIPGWMLKDVTLSATSDVEGFSQYMWSKTIFGAVVTWCYSAIYLIAQTTEMLEYTVFIPITYVAIAMAYMIILTGAKQRFLK